MMISSIVAALASGIGSKVLDYLKENKALSQFERMQGEILEGWLFKIQVAIREEHRAQGVKHSVHLAVMEKVNEVIEREFDTEKL